MLKILPKLFPGINNFFNSVEQIAKNLLNKPLIIAINKWLSYKNILIFLFFSLFIPSLPIIIAVTIMRLNIPIYDRPKEMLLWSLDLIVTYTEYFFIITSIMLFILLAKLTTSYITKRTLILLKTRKKNSLQFYLFAVLFIIIEEIIFAMSIFINNRN